jgi:flagellar hook-associated protein 3 FlgL
MRVNPNNVPDILNDLQQSQVQLNTALQEVSTGKSVNEPSDNPYAAAAMVGNTIETGDVDQYTQNVTSVLSTVQSASSTLSSVVTALTQAVSLGTEGANGTNTAANRDEIASQVQSVLQNVVSDANLNVGGAYVFGGGSTTTPYTADRSSATGYTYNGGSDVSTVAAGDQVNIQYSLPGSQIFSNSSNSVIGSLSSLVTALQSGTTSDISTAVSSVSSALSYVGQQQVFYSNAESQLNSQDSVLKEDTVTLTSQATNLVGINESTAATNLSQAETDNSAALAAAAKVLPTTLLNFLEPPS